MTLQDFADILAKLEIQYFYREADAGAKLPWIEYNSTLEPLLIADNYVYAAKRKFQIELYTKTKKQAEAIIEKLLELLDAHELIWDLSETIMIEQGYYLTYVDINQ